MPVPGLAAYIPGKAPCAGTIRRPTTCRPNLHPGPHKGILQAGIDPLLRKQLRLSDEEFRDLDEFVRDGLFDARRHADRNLMLVAGASSSHSLPRPDGRR